MTPQQKIAQLESLNQELMRLIREFKQVTDHPETTKVIQEKGAQLYEISQTLEEIRDSNLTMDQWMGQYLLGAKAEVTRLLTEAVGLARIVSVPVIERVEVGEIHPNNEGEAPLLEGESPSTPMSRLSEIMARSTVQCETLLEDLGAFGEEET